MIWEHGYIPIKSKLMETNLQVRLGRENEGEQLNYSVHHSLQTHFLPQQRPSVLSVAVYSQFSCAMRDCYGHFRCAHFQLNLQSQRCRSCG